MNKLIILMFTTAVFTQLADIPEPELKVRTFDYEVSLEHLCPNAPSEEAAQCMSSYNLSQSVEDTLIESVKDYPDKLKYGKVLQVTACSIQKVPTLLFNLHIFCYFKGENILAKPKSVKIRLVSPSGNCNFETVDNFDS